MFHLIRGDYCFSSWSVRAASLLELAGCNYQDSYLPLDWPMRFSGDDFVFVDLDLLPEDDACFCPCDRELLSRILENNQLQQNPILNAQPHVPVLIDRRDNSLLVTYRSILERIVKCTKDGNILQPQTEDAQSLMWQLIDHFTADYLSLMKHMPFAKSFQETHRRAELDVKLVSNSAEKFLLTLDRLVDRCAPNNLFPFGKMTCLEVTLAPFAQQFIGWDYPGLDKHPSFVYLHRIINDPVISRILRCASNPYDSIKGSPEGSPEWIACHYRYWKDYRIIHDWQNMVIHRLENDVAILIFECALQGQDAEEISTRVSRQYGIPLKVATTDTVGFLESISPASNERVHDKPLVDWSSNGH